MNLSYSDKLPVAKLTASFGNILVLLAVGTFDYVKYIESIPPLVGREVCNLGIFLGNMGIKKDALSIFYNSIILKKSDNFRFLASQILMIVSSPIEYFKSFLILRTVFSSMP